MNWIKNVDKKRFVKKIGAYAYIWVEESYKKWNEPEFINSKKSFGEFFEKKLLDYLENFDFNDRDHDYMFSWYNYVDYIYKSNWKDLSWEMKLAIFHMSIELAERVESAAEQAAGENW